jgi:hypothetical protein
MGYGTRQRISELQGSIGIPLDQEDCIIYFICYSWRIFHAELIDSTILLVLFSNSVFFVQLLLTSSRGTVPGRAVSLIAPRCTGAKSLNFLSLQISSPSGYVSRGVRDVPQ